MMIGVAYGPEYEQLAAARFSTNTILTLRRGRYRAFG